MKPTKFVRLWLSNKPTSKISAELNVSEATLYAYASKLRGLGVNLPKRTVSRVSTNTINVTALNELIESEKK